MIKHICGFFGVLFLGTTALAHCPVRVRQPVVVHHKPALLVTVVKPVFVPSAAYGAVYVPPVVTQAPAVVSPSPPANGIDATLAKILARLEALEKKQAPVRPDGQRPDPFNPQPQTTPVSVLNVFKAKCSQCHDAGNSTEKGGGLTLLENGTLSRLSDKLARKVITSSYAGRMPPKSSGIEPLTDAEVSSIVSHFDK